MAARHPGRIEGNAVALEHGPIGVEAGLRLGVVGRAGQEHGPADAVLMHQVLDGRLHPRPVVEHQAGHPWQLQADAAHAGGAKALDQTRDRLRPTEGREHARHDDDAVHAPGLERPEDRVVGRGGRAGSLERTAVEEEQMMARLPAAGIEHPPQPGLVGPFEEMRVVEERRQHEPAARTRGGVGCGRRGR